MTRVRGKRHPYSSRLSSRSASLPPAPPRQTLHVPEVYLPPHGTRPAARATAPRGGRPAALTDLPLPALSEGLPQAAPPRGSRSPPSRTFSAVSSGLGPVGGRGAGAGEPPSRRRPFRTQGSVSLRGPCLGSPCFLQHTGRSPQRPHFSCTQTRNSIIISLNFLFKMALGFHAFSIVLCRLKSIHKALYSYHLN